MNHTASFNRFEIELPDECVNDCSHQGQCDDDVAYWVPRITFPDAELIREELKEQGAWDTEELADDEQNKNRILWIAAGNVKDELAEAFRNQEFFFMDASKFENADSDTWMAEMMEERCDKEMSENEKRGEAEKLAGWYYWTCCPGCMPDSDAFGPFKTEELARQDCLSNS